MTTMKELSTDPYKPDWCPGCGNFVILHAVKQALVNLGLKKEEVVITSGIGCSSKFPQWINVFGLHGVHGRGLVMALGIKMANKKLKVIVVGGDGDIYGEGVNHFIEAIRDNVDITLLVHDNLIYGLTKGQASPITPKGRVTSSTPLGNPAYPLNPIALAISQDCGFVGRSTTSHMQHLVKIIMDAISYDGFSYVDILQQCVTFNKVNTMKWYKDHCYEIVKHKVGDKKKALDLAFKEDKLPIGVIYNINKDEFCKGHPILNKVPLVKRKLDELNFKDLLNEISY